MKSKKYIIRELLEARPEIDYIIKSLKDDPTFSEGHFRASLEHLYHHLNSAWHIRNLEEERIIECSEEDFIAWSKFPVGEIKEYK